MRGTVPLLAAMAAMVALVTCRAQDSGQPRPPTATSEPRVAVERKLAVEPPAKLGPAPPDVVAEPPIEPKPTPPPQVVVALATPFSPEALVMSPAHDGSLVVLFAEERAAVRRRVGAVLAAQRVELVPVVELERIEAAAAEGRLVLEGDQQCRAPLTPSEVAARYFPGRRTIDTRADCLDGCRVRAEVNDPPHYADLRTWESPEVSRPHDPKAWLKAASKVRPTEAVGIGGLGLIGTSHAPPIRFDPPVGIGPWATGQPDEASFDALENTVAGCAHPDLLVGFSWELRASVDRSGRITRCTAEADHSMARASSGTCICAAVETMQLEAGAAGRRLRVSAVDEGGFGRNAKLELVQPGTETWVTRLQEAPALSRCIDANPLPTALTARVILSLALDGAVDDVRIEGEITTPASMGLASCLVQELRLLPLPCRPPGVDALHVSLVVKGGP